MRAITAFTLELLRPEDEAVPAVWTLLTLVFLLSVFGLGVIFSSLDYCLIETVRGGVAGYSSSTSSSMHRGRAPLSTFGVAFG